jgi:hypothetical protein
MGCNPQNQSKHLFSANEHCAKNSEESVDKNKVIAWKPVCPHWAI